MKPRDQWLCATCRSFSDATGWPLQFTSIEAIGEGTIQQRAMQSCWNAEITNGSTALGVVHLEVPEGYEPQVSFEATCRLAELLVTNINRFLAQQAQVHEQAMEIGMLVGSKDGSDFRNRLRALLRASVCLASFRGAALFVLEPDGSALRHRLSYQIEDELVPEPRRHLIELPPDLEALDTEFVLIQREENADTSWLPEPMNSGLCVAIQSESGPIGTLWLYDRRFKDVEKLPRELLSGFANQIADVFERLVLLQDSETCDRLTRELEVISSTTEDIREVTASYPGCDVAVRCLSRLEVGGDLCEIVPFDEHRTVFVIGDGSGDSVPAAMVMTATRGAVHALLEVCRETNEVPVPHEFVGKLNRAILHVTAAQQFITLLFGVFDNRTGTLQYTNAGHCPPLRVQGDQITALDSQGLLLGVLDEATYTTADLQLEPDDLLILFSDGIVEARNANENMFRNEGILDAIAGRTFGSASDALHVIWRDYEIHTGGKNLDDRTLMVLRGAATEDALAGAVGSTFSGSQPVC